jgi:hypothetical protein
MADGLAGNADGKNVWAIANHSTGGKPEHTVLLDRLSQPHQQWVKGADDLL